MCLTHPTSSWSLSSSACVLSPSRPAPPRGACAHPCHQWLGLGRIWSDAGLEVMRTYGGTMSGHVGLDQAGDVTSGVFQVSFWPQKRRKTSSKKKLWLQ